MRHQRKKRSRPTAGGKAAATVEAPVPTPVSQPVEAATPAETVAPVPTPVSQRVEAPTPAAKVEAPVPTPVPQPMEAIAIMEDKKEEVRTPEVDTRKGSVVDTVFGLVTGWAATGLEAAKRGLEASARWLDARAREAGELAQKLASKPG